MATIHDLIEVTSIREHTTYSKAAGNILGIQDNVTSGDLNDGEFDRGDVIKIGGINYRIDRIQEPQSSGRFTLGDGTEKSFSPGDEDNLSVVFLSVSNGGVTRHFIIPNDSYGDMDLQSIRTGELEDVGGSDAAVISTGNNASRVVCFAAGTLIDTPGGSVPVESLRPGDLVTTLDNGPQPLLWSGMKRLGPAELEAAPHLRPVEIAADAFGNARPLIVSPQHGILLRLDGQQTLFRAIHLTRLGGGAVRQRKGCRRITYWHLFFERHQVILSNGLGSESYYPGAEGLRSLSLPARREVLSLISGPPAVADPVAAGRIYGAPARLYSRTCTLPDRLDALVAAR